MIITGVILILSGLLLDIVDMIFYFDDNMFAYCQTITQNLAIIGALSISTSLCSYKKIYTKTILFMLTVWRLAALVIILCNGNREVSGFTIAILNATYIIWLIRLRFMRKIGSKEPNDYESFYILFPISTFKGLFQAIFLPWHCPRYETRMISDGDYIWFIDKGKFVKKYLSNTTFDKKGIKVPFGRYIRSDEYEYLNSLVGKKAIPGVRDCRKFLIAGRV